MDVQTQTKLLGALLDKCPDLLVDLGKLETKIYQKKLEQVSIEQPIFICGLARSGSTILLELLSQHPATASFRYYDFPFVHFPLIWRALSKIIFNLNSDPVERAHKDRLMISPLSPEAFEEILWMYFFKDLHNVNKSQLLSATTDNIEFQHFYSNTLKKILLVEKKTRYLSKENYNICRIAYLKKLFPGAKFIIPVRHPVDHVASLLKQHAQFSRAERENPAVLQYMQRAGHFEFGLDRKAINVGFPEHSREIDSLFKEKKDIIAYAYQWQIVYEYAQQFENDPSVKIIKHEDLLEQPKTILRDLFNWLNLTMNDQLLQKLALKVTKSNYYQHQLDTKDLQSIMAQVSKTASTFGYH